LIGSPAGVAADAAHRGAGLLGIYYLLLFAIPLVGGRRLPVAPSPLLRAAAASGGLVTLLSIGFQLFPIVDVESPLRFGAKVAGVAVGANLVGVVLYVIGARRARRAG